MINYLKVCINLLVLFSRLCNMLNAQTVMPAGNANMDGMTIQYFFNRMELDSGYHFIYTDSSILNKKISLSGENISVKSLNAKLPGGNRIIEYSDHLFIISNAVVETPGFEFSYSGIDTIEMFESNGQSDYLRVNRKSGIEEINIGNKNANQGTYIWLSGTIYGREEDQPLIGASLYIRELEKGVITGSDGVFKIRISPGKYSLQLNNIGYREKEILLSAFTDGNINIYMDRDYYKLEEVVISPDNYDNVSGNQLGYNSLIVSSLKKLPMYMGDLDIMKTALSLPGIKTVGEGASGINVRGSPADQNLYYINDMPVYNTSHLFGFFSSFNPDALEDFRIFKGSIPVEYGGRIASIVDIRTKSNSIKKNTVRGGVSPVMANLLAEGRSDSARLTWLAGFRTTYSGWVFKMLDDTWFHDSRAWFGDYITNITWSPDEKNTYRFFSYGSSDKIVMGNGISNFYSTLGGSFTWERAIKRNTRQRLVCSLSRYEYQQDDSAGNYTAYRHIYKLEDIQAGYKLSMEPLAGLTMDIGASGTIYKISPAKHYLLSGLVPEKILEVKGEKALESGIYSGFNYDVNSFLSLTGGVRMNFYDYLSYGDQSVYLYADEVFSEYARTDTLNYHNNQLIKRYVKPDLRLGIRYAFNESFSIKAGYNETYQGIFMISNSLSASPTDKWKLSDYHIRPMRARQFSGGTYFKLSGGEITGSVEIYHKRTLDFVEYRDGANTIVLLDPELNLSQGSLQSFGLEFLLKKNSGNFTGWINYCYSRALVETTKLNGSRTYPANFDKPHSLNFTGSYSLNKRLSFSFNTAYSSGIPITVPTAVYYYQGDRLVHYSERNSFRLPAYFRTDLSIILDGNLKSDKPVHGSWYLSVYNVTGRDNFYSVYFRVEERKLKAYKVTIFPRPVFTLSYKFKLGSYND